MGKVSIGFVVLVLILGLFIGAVLGSIMHQVFGLDFLNRPIPKDSLVLARNFYLIKNLEVQLTPAAILGLIVSGWLLLRHKGKG